MLSEKAGIFVRQACFWFGISSLASPLFSQSMRLSTTTGSQGQQVSVDLYLTSPRGVEQPSTLQWETAIPIAQLSLVDENLPLGPVAQAAGKVVSCRVKTRTATVQTSICILYGGREPIRDGVVAILKLRIAPDALPGPARIRIDQGLAVLKDLERIPMKPSETIVKIGRK
jgi:hypothetical protein